MNRTAEAVTQFAPPFRERLRQLRLDRGWGIDTLADQAGLSRTTVHNLESGRTTTPRAPTLKKLARAFRTTVADLLAAPAGPTPPGPTTGTAQDDAERARQQLDRQTNPLVDEAYAERPRLFDSWTQENWNELFSHVGMGGPMTREGVIDTAIRINRKRQTQRQLEIIMETDLAEVAARMVDALYTMIEAPDPERRAGQGNVAP